MTGQTDVLPDLTDDLTFIEPDAACVDTLLDTGVVIIDPVVPADELEGVRRAVDTLFFESLHRRLFYKVFESAPSALVRDVAHHRHSRTSQFDPNAIPHRLADVAPAIDRVRNLDGNFFEDDRLRQMYADRPVRLNIADVSRSKPTQKAFVAHQDAANVTRLGHIVQPTDTRWRIHSDAAPAHTDYDYTFVARAGSVVTTLERAGERPRRLAAGQGFDWFLEDGSEVHSGDNLTEEIRHRLGVFAQETEHDEGIRDRLVAAVVSIKSLSRRQAAQQTADALEIS